MVAVFIHQHVSKGIIIVHHKQGYHHRASSSFIIIAITYYNHHHSSSSSFFIIIHHHHYHPNPHHTSSSFIRREYQCSFCFVSVVNHPHLIIFAIHCFSYVFPFTSSDRLITVSRTLPVNCLHF